MKGFKGFDKDLKCRNKQYEIGKTYEEDEAQLCNSGIHFCELPQDVFRYYSPGNKNRFAEIEADDVTEEKDKDSKRVCKKLSIKAEISVFDIVKISVSAFFERFNFEKKISDIGGDFSALQGGNSSALQGGDSSSLKGGYYSALHRGDSSALKGGDYSALKGGYSSALKGGD
jgi:hypothetical protein